MQRRHLLLATPALLLLTRTAMADSPKVTFLDDALHWLDRLDKAREVRSTTDWTMHAVLDHLAQSIEMSLDGFPQPKPVLFQQTVGAAAFTVFGWRGRMSHGLTEPIPGAPALPQDANWKPGAARLRAAIARFQAHTGALQPHFAYGALSRSDYARAHTFHIANHQDEISVSA